MWRHRYMSPPLAIVTSLWPIVLGGFCGRFLIPMTYDVIINWPKATHSAWITTLNMVHRRGNNKTVLLRDTVHQISLVSGRRADRVSPGESATGADRRTAPAADSPREIWWSVSRNYRILFLSRDVKNTKFNQYLPEDLTSLNVFNSRFRKPVMFWRWRYHGVALWRHGRGAWHNCLLLTKASNVNRWADVANHVTRLSQAGDTDNFERRITG